jgi:hypothetical protein
MKQKLPLIILLSAVSFYSCKKDIETNNSSPTYIDKNLSFLDRAISDSCNDSSFYIKGEFDGHPLCFATAGEAGTYLTDTFSNAYFLFHYDSVKKDSTTDNLYLIRQNANNSVMMALYCGQTHIESRALPYTQPHQNLEHCEFTEFDFTNMNHDYNIEQNSPQDNYTFHGFTGPEMTLTFTKLTPDNILEGEFNGILRTNTGSVIIVKNGKFRIRFVVSEQAINTN